MQELTRFFNALGDETRLRLVALLTQQEPGHALCVGRLALELGVTTSAVSQHLRVLKDLGLVHGERRGYHIHYFLDQERLASYQALTREQLGERFVAGGSETRSSQRSETTSRKDEPPTPILLAVFAHPDDETFRCGGTLALLSRRGVGVQVLCATRGEAGPCGNPPFCSREELPAMREQELCCACAALGIEPPLFLGYRDGELVNVNEGQAVEQIVEVVRTLRPQILLTWPSDGLSGHPDHIAVSRWATLAFEQAGAMGMATPAALYHLAVPRSVAEALGLAQLHAIADEDVTLAVDVTDAWAQKMAAIRCHRTQAGGSPILEAPEARQRLFLGREHFRRAAARDGHDLMLELQEE